jgi:NAD(P) transhydrogenase subunit alpha
MLKDNVIVLDWDDEILAKTVLTHAGRHRRDATEEEAFPSSGKKAVADKPAAQAA